MAHKIFLDTDVVIDFFTDRYPHAAPMGALFELAHQQKVKLFISAVSINNIYYVVRKYAGHVKTIGILKTLLEWVAVAGTGKEEVLRALENDFADFEDGIQYATALHLGQLDLILTRNIKDFKKSELPLMTPVDFLKLVKTG